MIKKFLNRLFCNHCYVYRQDIMKTFHEADFSDFGYNTWSERYEVYECIKCGKKKYKHID